MNVFFFSVWFLCYGYVNANSYGQEGSSNIDFVGQPTRGVPPAWGLDDVLTTPHRKKLPCYETLNPNESKFHLVPQLFLDLKKAYDSARMEVLYNVLIELGYPHKTGKPNKTVSE